MDTLATPRLDFDLPAAREATAPPEHRGFRRDHVRLLVSRPGLMTHTRFDHLPDHLRPGDLLVVNTSPTMAAALDATYRGRQVVVHLSTRHDDDRWEVELRHTDGTGPVLNASPMDRVHLIGQGTVALRNPAGPPSGDGVRVWVADVEAPAGIDRHLRLHGRPIRYAHTDGSHPLSAHQTTFASLTGRLGTGDVITHGASAEMASAGRPFTPLVVTELVRRGVAVAPITLHAGVASLEDDEAPRPEPYAVQPSTADMVNATRARGGRVVAVGTTATRALETSADTTGTVMPARGWTDLVLGPDRPARVVDGLVTGWHAPRASHLQLLEAVVGRDRMERAYRTALAGPYLWHEFGDSCLFLPD